MVYDVYTDGSYKEVPGYGPFCASAATIQVRDKEDTLTTLTKVFNDENLVSQRNIIGEVMAVMMIFEHCLNVLKLTQDDTVVLHYDYVGIHNWLKNKGEKDYWRQNNWISQSYRDYMNNIVRTRMRVEFVHTPGHSGIAGNERADRLVKDALNQHIRNIMTEAR